MFKNTVLLFVLVLISCGNFSKSEENPTPDHSKISVKSKDVVLRDQKDDEQTGIVVGANQTGKYLKLLKGKKVGIVANQTSVIFKNETTEFTHVVDSLVSLGIDIRTVFVPEHGFRGKADAGEHVKDGIDTATGLPISSLYGDHKKPNLMDMDIDVMIFDLQDVGARFYTYISTLHYVMEACAEANIPLLILDRPNPNGSYVDGPILEMAHTSYVGMHPVPMVHGMTIGEYAHMINGEKWLKNGVSCSLTIVPVLNYTHQTKYHVPIKPSPNLPNDIAINLYPSLCLFEGTNVSVGRGTPKQFQIYGSPYLYKDFYSFKFLPQPNEGAKNPPHQGTLCYGKDLSSSESLNALNLNPLIEAYQHTIDKKSFFNSFFTKLAGTTKLQNQIEQGLDETAIKKSWEEGLNGYKQMRKAYLIYE